MLDRIVRVAGEIGEVAALYTMFDDGRPLTPAIDALRASGRVRVSSLNRHLRRRRWMLPLYPRAVRELSEQLGREHGGAPQAESGRGIDLLVSTSSAAVHGVRAPDGVAHLCYCHSPARYLWAQGAQYRNPLAQAGLRVLGGRLRRLDLRASASVTRYIANSHATKALVRSVWGRDSRVIFPPVRTAFFTPAGAQEAAADLAALESLAIARTPFLLVAGALEPYKRVDVAIGAALALGRTLVIAGGGTMLKEVRRAARGHALLLAPGRVTDAQLRALYRQADALLFPQMEDFGITAVEAQACGTPVVALGRGGALDSVIDGVTGVFCREQTAASLAEAVDRVPRKPECAEPCREHSLRFSEERFDHEIRGVMLDVLRDAPSLRRH